MKVMVVSCLLATVLAGQVLASSYESSTYPVPVPTYPTYPTPPPTYPTYPTPPPTYPMYPTPSPMYPAYPKQDSSEESSEEEGTYSQSHHAEPYAFEYHVKDEPSYNSYGQQEARNDKVVSGHYYVDLPDGRRQTVTYKDDGHGSGFVADVKYDKAAADVNYLPPLPTPSYYPKPPAYTPYAPPSPVYPKY